MSNIEIINKYNLEKYVPSWESSWFQERILRFGVEARTYSNYGGKFDIHLADCQNLVRKSFIDDMIKFIKYNHHLTDDKLRRWISTCYA